MKAKLHCKTKGVKADELYMITCDKVKRKRTIKELVRMIRIRDKVVELTKEEKAGKVLIPFEKAERIVQIYFDMFGCTVLTSDCSS